MEKCFYYQKEDKLTGLIKNYLSLYNEYNAKW